MVKKLAWLYINIQQSELQNNENQRGSRGPLHNEKRVNWPRGHNSPQCAHISQQSFKNTGQQKTERIEKKNRKNPKLTSGDFSTSPSNRQNW